MQSALALERIYLRVEPTMGQLTCAQPFADADLGLETPKDPAPHSSTSLAARCAASTAGLATLIAPNSVCTVSCPPAPVLAPVP